MSLFKSLFSGKPKQPAVSAEEQKKIETKRGQFEIARAKEDLDRKLQENELKIQNLEARIRESTRLAVEAKRAGQKDRALRLLTEIKALKAQAAKTSGYNVILMKNLANLGTVEDDGHMAEVLSSTTRVLDRAKDQADRNMDILQDAAAVDQDIEYQQQQLQDLISQQTSKMAEGLEDDYAALDELDQLEMLDAMGGYDAKAKLQQSAVAGKHAVTGKGQAQAGPKNAPNSYDNLLNDLLS